MFVIITYLFRIAIAIIFFIWLSLNTLYFLLHVVINIVVSVQSLYQRLWVKKNSLPKEVVSDILVLMENMPRLRKPLSHLVVLVDTEHHTISELARVVIWSLVTKVRYLSFHDVTGNLKQDEEKLLKEVERQKKRASNCSKFHSNSFTDLLARYVVINILGSNGGRRKIAQIIRRIAAEAVQSPQKREEITVEEMDSRHGLVYPFPEPEIVLYTGQSCCIHGCLAWQIRLTEFVRLSFDHTFDVYSFINALYKYNDCDQRFGK